MSHEENSAGRIMGRPGLFLGMMLGSMFVLLPLGIIVTLEFGIDPADYSDRHTVGIFGALLASLTAGFASPSGTRATVLAVLGGFAVALLAFAGYLAPELYLLLGGEVGPAAGFALRLGGMVPALAVAGLTIRGLAPLTEASPAPEAPNPGEQRHALRRGFEEAAAGIAVMVGGFLAMFGGWETLGRFIPDFPHPAMLSVPALFGAVMAGALAFGLRVEAKTGHVKSFLGGMAFVALVWVATTAAVLAAISWGGTPAGEEGQWDAAIVGTFAGCSLIFVIHGVVFFLWHRRRPQQSAQASTGASRPAMAAMAPAHSVTVLVLVVVLWDIARTVWPDGGGTALVVPIFAAMTLVRARPYGLTAWARALGVVLAVFVLFLGGFLLGGLVADRWAGDSVFLATALMLAIVVPAALVAMTIPVWLGPAGAAAPAPLQPRDGF